MAENIGKIIVSIEAEVAELRKGLASAEAEFKKSAKKIEESQAMLGQKFKKSWVELSSKINVYLMALNVAEGLVRGLSGAMKVFGEEGSSSAEKVGGAILAFGDAGIPIVSQVIGLAEGLAEMFVRSSEKIQQVQKDLEDLNQSFTKMMERRASKAMGEDFDRVVNTMATRIEIMRRETGKDVDEDFQLKLKRANERENLEANLQKRVLTIGQKDPAEIEGAVANKKRMLELFDFETTLLKTQLAREQKLRQEAREEEFRLAKEAAEKLKQQKINDAKAVAAKTRDLQTQLNIMIAKQAGDEEKARTLAIEGKYDKMLDGASQVNKRIIEQMKAIELAAVMPDNVAGADPDNVAGSATASISTAIGNFTLAAATSPAAKAAKKQTAILETIAENTEKTQGQQEIILAQ
jgi:hypothetical protein